MHSPEGAAGRQRQQGLLQGQEQRQAAAVTGERLPQKGALRRGAEALTAAEYVARTLPLLELEREAEVAQVRRSLLKCAF